jgi:hypothetical protein
MNRIDELVRLLEASTGVEVDASLLSKTPVQSGGGPAIVAQHYFDVALSAHKLQLDARVATMEEMRETSKKKLSGKREVKRRLLDVAEVEAKPAQPTSRSSTHNPLAGQVLLATTKTEVSSQLPPAPQRRRGGDDG